jgi:RNA polymerase sigma factor (TIGR02999 family)
VTEGNVSRILMQIEAGDPSAAEALLPLVYDELRKLAAAKMAQEQPGHTLQATALVHEAYLRLVGKTGEGTEVADPPGSKTPIFDSRGHFFAAAAEAMRRILVENARHKASAKRGGDRLRERLEPNELPLLSRRDPLEIMAVHEALERLRQKSPRKSELVKLRYFLGCTLPEAAAILGIAPATAEEDWTFARAWLRREWLRGADG